MPLPPSTDFQKRVIIYGAPFTGKTFAAGQVAELGYNLHYLDFDNNAETLQSLSPEARQRINYFRLSYNDAALSVATITAITQGLISSEQFFCNSHGRFQCTCADAKLGAIWNPTLLSKRDVLVIDSGSSWTSALEVKLAGKIAGAKLDFDAWAAMKFELNKTLTGIKTLPCHVILISHEEVLQTEENKSKIQPRLGSRAYSSDVAKWFTDCVYSTTEGGARVFRSSPLAKPNIVTGTRTLEVEKAPNKLIPLSAIFPKIT